MTSLHLADEISLIGVPCDADFLYFWFRGWLRKSKGVRELPLFYATIFKINYKD